MTTLNRLKQGYQSFYQANYGKPSEYQGLAYRQAPKSAIVSCSDSRVSPLSITNAKAGELFVIRNVANLVPPYQPDMDSLHGVSAALEYAVCHLQVDHLIVMGHSDCGGVKALRDGVAPPEGEVVSFIRPWVQQGEAIVQSLAHLQDSTEHQHACEKALISHSLKNLRSFPWIASRLRKGELKLHGWYFQIHDGQLMELNEEDGSFQLVNPSL